MAKEGMYVPERKGLASAEALIAAAELAEAKAIRSWIESLQRAEAAGDWTTVRSVAHGMAIVATWLETEASKRGAGP